MIRVERTISIPPERVEFWQKAFARLRQIWTPETGFCYVVGIDLDLMTATISVPQADDAMGRGELAQRLEITDIPRKR